jgi:hypothetical protein
MPPLRRPSDRDRSRAVELLRSGYLDGRLSTETFEARVASAYTAPTTASLRELLSDLGAEWRARLQALIAPLLEPPVDASAGAAAPLGAAAALDEPAPPPVLHLTLLLSHRPPARPGAGVSRGSVRAAATDRLLLGRASSCDVVIASDAVSRLHLAIEREAGVWWATDLGSTNGTWLEGAPVRRARLRRGARLQLADALVHVG